jgi:hypothetical protein
MKIKQIVVREDDMITVKSVAGTGDNASVELSNGTKIPKSAILPGAQPNTVALNPDASGDANQLVGKTVQEPTSEGIFGTSEEELAKLPVGNPAGDYYRKLVALKTDPRWTGKQDIIQSRIQDLITKLDDGRGIPQPGYGQPAGPETDPTKFMQKNPGFKESGDTVASGNTPVGGDATDNFRDEVIDKEFDAANRNNPAQGTRSPISEKLKESDELMKWLTIAGIK